MKSKITRELTFEFIREHDITDPTPYEEYIEEDNDKPLPVLEGQVCPICGKGFMSNDWITRADLEGDYENRHGFWCHTNCIGAEAADFIEHIGYSISDDLGSFWDSGVIYA